MDLLKTFEKYELISIPRAQNSLANELSFATIISQIPHANEKDTVKVKNQPIVLDNIDYWQVFEGDKQIDGFLQFKNEFAIPKLSLEHEQDCPNEEKTPKTEPFPSVDVNILEHFYEA